MGDELNKPEDPEGFLELLVVMVVLLAVAEVGIDDDRAFEECNDRDEGVDVIELVLVVEKSEEISLVG